MWLKAFIGCSIWLKGESFNEFIAFIKFISCVLKSLDQGENIWLPISESTNVMWQCSKISKLGVFDYQYPLSLNNTGLDISNNYHWGFNSSVEYGD